MQKDGTKRRDCEESAPEMWAAELAKIGAGALIATGTIPACARAQTEQRSGARDACG
jgi:hypothetical protein